MTTRKRNPKRFSITFRWEEERGSRIGVEVPPLGRRVRTVAGALLFVFLLVLIAEITGIEIPTVFEVIKQVIAMLIQL